MRIDDTYSARGLCPESAVSDFDEDVRRQEEMFGRFVEWLQKRSNVIGVTRASRTDDLRGIDLWAVVEAKDPVPVRIPIQVKVDFRLSTTGNLAVETIGEGRFDGETKPGWLFKLHNTELLAYIDGVTGAFRIYRSADIYDYVVKHMNHMRAFGSLNGRGENEDFWWGMGVLCHINSVADLRTGFGDLNRMDSGGMELKHRWM